VTNLGPGTALGVVVTNLLPTGAGIVSTSTGVGGVSTSGSAVIWMLGDLAPGAQAGLTIRTAPAMAGTLIDVASLSGQVTDLDPGNNTALFSTTVSTPAAVRIAGTFSAGYFRLTVTGQAGMSYMVQTSSDLSSWVTLGTYVTSGSGSFSITDSNSPAANVRFYRAVRVVP
jgi:Domain of unknown function DUF11